MAKTAKGGDKTLMTSSKKFSPAVKTTGSSAKPSGKPGAGLKRKK
jgi:hypothetical protein